MNRNTQNQAMLEKLEGIVRRKRKVLILTHDSPDPDALAAAFAFKHLLHAKWNVGSVIAFGGMIGRAENAAMTRLLKIETKPASEVNIRDFRVVALVDTQPGTGNNSLPRGIDPGIVIDHHVPIYSRTLKAPFHDVRTDYGSTSAILTEYLVDAGLDPIDRKIATALLYGIKADTRDLGRETTPQDMAAYLVLFPHALLKILSRIEHPKVSRCYFKTFEITINRALIDRDVVISDLGSIRKPDSLAEMADFLIRIEGVKWALCLGEFRGGIYFSFRTTTRQGNAGLIARKMTNGIGSGGGHHMTAAGKVDIEPQRDNNGRTKTDLLISRFLKETKRPDFKGEKL